MHNSKPIHWVKGNFCIEYQSVFQNQLKSQSVQQRNKSYQNVKSLVDGRNHGSNAWINILDRWTASRDASIANIWMKRLSGMDVWRDTKRTANKGLSSDYTRKGIYQSDHVRNYVSCQHQRLDNIINATSAGIHQKSINVLCFRRLKWQFTRILTKHTVRVRHFFYRSMKWYKSSTWLN
jgi:hypothetical protein